MLQERLPTKILSQDSPNTLIKTTLISQRHLSRSLKPGKQGSTNSCTVSAFQGSRHKTDHKLWLHLLRHTEQGVRYGQSHLTENPGSVQHPHHMAHKSLSAPLTSTQMKIHFFFETRSHCVALAGTELRFTCL